MCAGTRLMLGLLLAAVTVTAASAQEAFFKGKQIRILLSAGVSGGYNEYARLLTQHLGNHLAGRSFFTACNV